MKKPRYRIALQVQVTDLSDLYRAGLAAARASGLNRFEWRAERSDPRHASPAHADVLKIFETGADLLGCTVEASAIEEIGA